MIEVDASTQLIVTLPATVTLVSVPSISHEKRVAVRALENNVTDMVKISVSSKVRLRYLNGTGPITSIEFYI